MKNITGVRAELSAVYAGLKDGSIDVKTAESMNNCAGKIISSLKVELEYYALRKEEPTVEFFKS